MIFFWPFFVAFLQEYHSQLFFFVFLFLIETPVPCFFTASILAIVQRRIGRYVELSCLLFPLRPTPFFFSTACPIASSFIVHDCFAHTLLFSSPRRAYAGCVFNLSLFLEALEEYLLEHLSRRCSLL